MPTTPDMSMDMTTAADAGLLDTLQHQVAVFARRAEQTRLGGVGQVRNSMDRAAYLLLNRLDSEGPMGVKALAASMGIDSSTVTRQVAPLVETGFVKRTSHPEDGRAVVLELSARGHARLAEVRSSRRELMAALTHDWEPAERRQFCVLLSRFNTALSARQAAQNAGSATPSDSAPGTLAAAASAPLTRSAPAGRATPVGTATGLAPAADSTAPAGKPATS
jgi:DNA-binding MarR family transcriptional regulator